MTTIVNHHPLDRVWPPTITHTTTNVSQVIATFDLATIFLNNWNNAVVFIEARILSWQDAGGDGYNGYTKITGSAQRVSSTLSIITNDGGVPIGSSLTAATINANADNHTVEIKVTPKTGSFQHYVVIDIMLYKPASPPA